MIQPIYMYRESMKQLKEDKWYYKKRQKHHVYSMIL
jgi:hypothetical protein